MNENNNLKEPKEDGAQMEKHVRKSGDGTNIGIRSKRGIYTAAISALVISIAIVFNLVVGGLPAGTLEYDITGHDLYTVTEQSVDYLETLEQDVSIVVLAQNNTIDERVSKFINNYAKLSSHITLKIVDPVLDPTALTAYNAKENEVVISCEATNKTKILNLAGMEGYQDGLILYDANAYQYYNQLQAVSLDAEGQLTSAINNVTSETTNRVYLLSGHNETVLGVNAASYLSKANYETASLNLLTDGKVPDDCKLILCNNPTTDLADDELDMLASYLQTGGKVLLFMDNPTLSNYNALLAIYGLQMQNGYIGDNDRYYKAYTEQYGIFCIYPVLSKTSDVTASITADAFLRGARGMLQITPERRASVLTPFMTTSANGVLAIDESNATNGEYILGATAVETFADKADVQTRLTVITAIDLLSDDISARANLSNMDIVISAVNKNFAEAQNIVIPVKSLDLATTTIAHPIIWSVIFIGVIPAAFLAGGLFYWNKRRKR